MHTALRRTPVGSSLHQARLAARVRSEAARLRGTASGGSGGPDSGGPGPGGPGSGGEDARLLAELIRRAMRWRLSPDERHWVRRIEAERRRLARSTEIVHRQEELPLTVAEVSRASQPWRGGRFLYAAVRAFRPSRGVELGTCLGVSAAYQAAALGADGHGRLVTIEGYPDLAARARRFLADVDLRNVEVVVGRFGQVLEPIVAAEPVDYAYVDGNHHEAPTLEYFSVVRRHCTKRTLLVFDDIRWSGGMWRAWNRIVAADGVTAHADLGRLGLVIVRPTD